MPFRRDDGLCLEYPGIVHKHRDLGVARRDAHAGLARFGQQREIGDDELDARPRHLARDPASRGLRTVAVARKILTSMETGVRASPRAIQRPMPPVAPVMTATGCSGGCDRRTLYVIPPF